MEDHHEPTDREPGTHRSRRPEGALQAIAHAARRADIPETTLYLVELRASQINGCGVCVDMHSRELKDAGEPDARINTVAAWRDVSYFSEAERAALALTEAATRLADRPDAVSDDVWNEAARHYDEAQLAALVLAIAAINTWNRLNVVTQADQRRVGGPVRRPEPEGHCGGLTRVVISCGVTGWRAAPVRAARQHARTGSVPTAWLGDLPHDQVDLGSDAVGHRVLHPVRALDRLDDAG